MYMKLKDGKSKVLTLSYDDGVVQDIRLIEILNKSGIKATFNINTGRYLLEEATREKFYGRMKLSEAKELYINSGHEVAVHAVNHPFLERLKTDEILTEVLDDRRNIERQYGTLARGMAYPFGTYNNEVIECLDKCGICYSRTTKSTENFKFPENWLELHPTCHHNNPKLMDLAKKFVEGQSKWGDSWMFYLWGHSYEFDNNENWEVIEQFAEYIGGRDDIWYATNIEIYDYVKAYESLQTSVDKGIVHNPSAIDVWFLHQSKTYCVEAGQTLCI
ncbi:MAG: polysaccharide deacetylase family protein [Oscillospiraceae bacterium]|nr:polysaccharide deacetylase family protein [Oscillospiraceae bacterium]